MEATRERAGSGTAGAIAGAISALAFTALHDVLISDIWATLPVMLLAGAVCGGSIAWSHSLVVARPGLAGWAGYNAALLTLFGLLGATSVIAFDPITTIAEVVAAQEAPSELIARALPLTVAFTFAASVLLSVRYARHPRHVGAILLTVVVLVMFLGLNVSIIGLVEVTAGTGYLIAELFGLTALLDVCFAVAYVLLMRWVPRARVGTGDGPPTSARP